MIRAVCFDMGGTLHTISHTPERRLRFAAMLKERLADYGIDIPDDAATLASELAQAAEAYKSWSDETLREEPADIIWAEHHLKKYNIPCAVIAPFAEELSFKYDYIRGSVVRRPQIRETFLALLEMDVRIGIISNIISRSIVPHFLEEYGVSDLVSCVITSAESGIRKPDPAIYRLAEEALGLRPAELAYVGDTIARDVIGTRAAGWRMMIKILTPSPSKRDARLSDETHPSDYIIRELSEIPAIIRAANED